MTVVEQKLHDKISNVVRYGGGRVYADSWGNGSISTDVAEAFTSQMHTQLLAPAQSAVEAGIFSGLRRVLDVGGGSGALCIALTRSQQGTSSTLMDLPAVCEVAKRFVDEAGVRGIDYWPANFFEDRWPDGFDGVWFSNIFHNFSGEQCFELASKARQALVPGGKLFLHEMLLDKSAPSFVPGVFDLLMFMNHSARQFHEEDFRRLLDEARFENVRRVHTFGYYSTIEATRAL